MTCRRGTQARGLSPVFVVDAARQFDVSLDFPLVALELAALKFHARQFDVSLVFLFVARTFNTHVGSNVVWFFKIC